MGPTEEEEERNCGAHQRPFSDRASGQTAMKPGTGPLDPVCAKLYFVFNSRPIKIKPNETGQLFENPGISTVDAPP